MKSCITLLLFLSTCVLCTPPILPVVYIPTGFFFTCNFKPVFQITFSQFHMRFSTHFSVAPPSPNYHYPPPTFYPQEQKILIWRLFTSLFRTPPPTKKDSASLPTRAGASEFGLERRQSRKASSLAYIICICILRMQSASARRFAYSGSHFQTSFPYLNLGKFTYSSLSLPFPLNSKHFLIPHYHTAIHSQNENTTATHSHFAYITATFSKCECSATLQ